MTESLLFRDNRPGDWLAKEISVVGNGHARCRLVHAVSPYLIIVLTWLGSLSLGPLSRLGFVGLRRSDAGGATAISGELGVTLLLSDFRIGVRSILILVAVLRSFGTGEFRVRVDPFIL